MDTGCEKGLQQGGGPRPLCVPRAVAGVLLGVGPCDFLSFAMWRAGAASSMTPSGRVMEPPASTKVPSCSRIRPSDASWVEST